MNAPLSTRHLFPPAPSVKHAFRSVVFPASWETVRLDDCIEPDAPICYGILMPGDNVPNGIPVVKVTNYEGGELRTANLVRTSAEIESQYKRSRLIGGDLLLAIRGSVGSVAVTPQELTGANITQDTARLRIRSGISREYLLQVLRGAYVQRQIELNTVGQAVQGINIGDVRQLIIPLPPLYEQERLGGLGSNWDQTVSCMRRLISVKQQLKCGLMQQLLTGRRRFQTFARSKAVVETRYGCFPSDWAEKRVGSIAREVSTRAANASLPVLSCTKHDGLVDSLQYFGKQVFSEDTGNYKVVRRGQFAYATNHIEEGSIGLLTHVEAGLVSPMYTVFAVDDQVDAFFLYALFKTELYRHIFESNTNASVDRRGSLRWAQFARLPLFLPSIAEQRRIAAVLKVCDDEIRLLARQLDRFKEQKKGLMQKLLTGQMKTRETR